MRKNKLLVIGYGLSRMELLLKRRFGIPMCSFIVMLLSGLVIGLTGCAKQEIKNVDSNGTNIICYGDSLTFGYGANAGNDYPSLLAKETAVPIINAGIDGDTSINGLERIDSDVLDRQPLLVIIEFGGNDFLEKVPMEATVNNIKQMVDKIQAKAAMVAIVDISAGMLFKDYHRQLSKIARQKGTIFIPGVLSGIITNPGLKSDFFHPNDRGYNLIAQRIYRTILPYVKKNKIIKQAKI